MAATAKMATRALRATPLASTMRPAARRVAVPRQAFQRQARRGYASEAPKPSGGSNTALIGGIAAVALAGLGYYTLGGNAEGLKQSSTAQGQKGAAAFTPTNQDYQKVYDFIAKKLIDEDDYDDGSYGPVLLRLGWHASGTYDKETGTGGSNGATMRFPPEGDHGANAGLVAARDFLEPVKKAFDLLHVSPKNKPHSFNSSSPLANAAGYVDVHDNTTPHKLFPNVWSAGDASSLPTSKTVAAITAQAPVLVSNLLRSLSNPGESQLEASYDGYTSCPLLTEYGKVMLAEFKYGGVPKETFNAMLGGNYDQAVPRRTFWHLKKDFFPWVYKNYHVKGNWGGPNGFK